MDNISEIRSLIRKGDTAIGLELGSTRIKSALVDGCGRTLAVGSFSWENKYINGYWTYSPDEIFAGVSACYASLKAQVQQKYGITLTTTGRIGISAMMHGYLVLDRNDNLLTDYRTWRNGALKASETLTQLFGFNIPARWSVAHLYEELLNRRPYLPQIAYMTTLAGYIHYKLTGKQFIGAGDASGMMPLNKDGRDYCPVRSAIFDKILADNNIKYTLRDILPVICPPHKLAGHLTEDGARLLDKDGDLKAGIPFCAPEGDAQTGMAATDSVAKNSGNVSAGTSIFGMFVLSKPLSKVYPEIDVVNTPSGDSVAMVHCNNCSSEIDAWQNVAAEIAELCGVKMEKHDLLDKLFLKSLEGDADCGKLICYNYLSGENITRVEKGAPTLTRPTDGKYNLANIVRAQLYSAFAAFKIGMRILENEGIAFDSICAHGGIFKTEDVAQRYLSAALNAPVTVTKMCGEGGAWGMALLALYNMKNNGESLDAFLKNNIFKDVECTVTVPDKRDVEGFSHYLEKYEAALQAERIFAEVLNNA